MTDMAALRADRWYGSSVDAGLPLERLAAAGWIDEEPGARPASWLAAPAPTAHLRWRTGANAVLVTTGAFDPFHTGHLSMLELARAALTERGLWVAGAVVSPSHDDYVSTKRSDAACAAERIATARSVLAGADWVAVDDAEALVAAAPVNFTSVLDRIHTAAAAAAPRRCDVGVFYVFGSDNAAFADAFWAPPTGCGAVMVRRGGIDRRRAPRPASVVVTDDVTPTVSSTSLRSELAAA